MCKGILRAAAIAVACILGYHAQAQVECVKCPANANGTGLAPGLTAKNAQGEFITTVGSCETFIVQGDLGYKSQAGTTVFAAYYGGTARIIAIPGSSVFGTPESTNNVTPAELATTVISPGGCNVPGATAETTDLLLTPINYTPTAADIAAGSVTFFLDYSGGTALLPVNGVCSLPESGTTAFTVQILPAPTCSIANSTQTVACVDGQASFTVVPVGTEPFTYCWQKGCPPAGACLDTDDTLSFSNPTAADAGCYTVTVTDAFGCTTTCTATLIVEPCPPKITITKEVVCAPEGFNGTCADGPGYSDTANGIVGAAFCYKITVTNTGEDAINGIVISDSTGLVFSPAIETLAVGETKTAFASATYNTAGTVVNTVTITEATGASSGANACETEGSVCTDSATVTVVPISVECVLALSSSLDMDGIADNGHVTLPADQQNAPINIVVKVHNPSTIPLEVSVTDLPSGLVLCSDSTTPAPAPTSILVSPGGDGTINLECLLVSCPAGANISVTVVGTAVATEEVPCIYNADGTAITTAPHTCTADVTCQAPATCRTTGGGVLLPDQVQESECDGSITTHIEGPDCNGAEAVKITHGGQLGAPFSNPSCGNVTIFPQGDPCIRGQWEHVRHYQGKANPTTSVAVDNFHSNTPKGIFDMLQCACLPCCENPDAGGQVGGLCNPDDHSICGPEPRPAPANAIIFTGVGYIKTCTTASANGKAQAQAVIFRVYIEDRSEPGGQHPGGGNAPADVYCFQAWAINGNIDTAPNIALRQAVATDSCNFINTYTQGSLPNASIIGTPLINDCGAMHTGNHQIHPSTSATCTPPAAD